MSRISVRIVCRIVAVLSVCRPTFAHHGSSAYQNDKIITLTGTVTEWSFSYPHPQLYFDVNDENGKIVLHWISEIPSTPILMKNVGWGKESVKPGDQLVISCNPPHTATAKSCLARKLLINGKEMPGFGNGGPQH